MGEKNKNNVEKEPSITNSSKVSEDTNLEKDLVRVARIYSEIINPEGFSNFNKKENATAEEVEELKISFYKNQERTNQEEKDLENIEKTLEKAEEYCSIPQKKEEYEEFCKEKDLQESDEISKLKFVYDTLILKSREDTLEVENYKLEGNKSLEGFGFEIPVYQRNSEGKLEHIGNKETVYARANSFQYLTSTGANLMSMRLTPEGDNKTLILDSQCDQYDTFIKLAAENPKIVKTMNDGKISVEIKAIDYNPTSEMTISFAQGIKVDGEEYNSIDVLSKAITLRGKENKLKHIYIAPEGELIDQKLPSNFFDLFSQEKINCKAFPRQQLQSLIKGSKELKKLPKGIDKVKEYELTNGKNIRTLELKGVADQHTNEPTNRFFAQMGRNVVEIDRIYKIQDEDNSQMFNLVFGSKLDLSSSDNSKFGRYKKAYQMSKIEESDIKRFEEDIKDFNLIADYDKTLATENMAATTRMVDADKRIINKITPPEKEEEPKIAEEPKIVEEPKAVEEPKVTAGKDIGHGDYVDVMPRAPRVPRMLNRVLKYALMAIATIAIAGLGIAMLMTPGIGIVQGALFVGGGLLMGSAMSKVVANDIKNDSDMAIKQAEENVEKLSKEKIKEETKEQTEELERQAQTIEELSKENSEKDKTIREAIEEVEELTNIVNEKTSATGGESQNNQMGQGQEQEDTQGSSKTGDEAVIIGVEESDSKTVNKDKEEGDSKDKGDREAEL